MKLFGWFSKFPKLSLQKKYIGFFSVVPLFLLSAVIQVPCPACGGTGYISSGVGMGQVTVVNAQSTVVSVANVDACLVYRLYTFNVVLTLLNTSKTTDAQGYVKLSLIDPTTSTYLQEDAYVVATVPANSQVENFFTTQFVLHSDLPPGAQIVGNVELNAQKCSVSNGTGKVSLNSWLLAKFEKQTSDKVQQASVLTVPPQIALTETPEIWIGQEGSTDNWYQLHPTTTQ